MAARATTVDEAMALARAGFVYAAGRTVLRAGTVDEEGLVDIARLPGLDRIDQVGNGQALRIGALVTLERLRRNEGILARNPALAGILALVAGLGVRTLATIGGNIGWGAGDLVPVLLANGATLETTAGPCEVHRMPPGALVMSVLLPAEAPLAFAEKVGYRTAFSPSLLTVAFGAELEDGRLRSVRIAAGAGVTPAQRLAGAEACLEGDVPGEIDFVALAQAIRAELQTTGDPFASAAHRVDVGARVITGRLADLLT
jgi:CO/xanthine dehydrogenase FAD-binding subunit